MSRIYWDAMLFIYSIEEHPIFAPQVRRLHKKILEREDSICTSVFAAGEVLTGPLKAKDFELARRIRVYFNSGDVELIPFTAATAEIYAEIRASRSVSQADAIHLATAAQAKADLFLTNDKNLHRLTVPGISFIAGLDGKLI